MTLKFAVGFLSIPDCQKRMKAWRAYYAGSFYEPGLEATHSTSAHVPWARLSPVVTHTCKGGSAQEEKVWTWANKNGHNDGDASPILLSALGLPLSTYTARDGGFEH